MRIRKRNSGSAATPALLSLIIVALVAITVYVFASNLPWAVRPAPITSVGAEIDHQYDLTLAVTATVFILSQLGLAFAIFNFRDHGQKAHFSRGSNTLEAIWTTATIVLFLGLGLMGHKAWAEVRFTPAAARRDSSGSHRQPVRIQFPLPRSRWKIRPARSQTDQRLYRKSAGN